MNFEDISAIFFDVRPSRTFFTHKPKGNIGDVTPTHVADAIDTYLAKVSAP